MTLYLDTTSLVKLYVDDEGSIEVAALVARAEVVATSAVAYPEGRAALARLRRERLFSTAATSTATRQLDADWPDFLAVTVTGAIARSAGMLADRLGLGGSEAIHLASFQFIRSRTEDEVVFSSADMRLAQAAARLGKR